MTSLKAIYVLLNSSSKNEDIKVKILAFISSSIYMFLSYSYGI